MAEEAAQHVDSAGDDRTANNAVRHQYRVLTDDEKNAMTAIKDDGAAMITLIERTADAHGRLSSQQRCYALARTKLEEAVMWAVKGLTA